MKRRTFLFIRHPEASKNIEDRHGGDGTPLTIRGLKQCDKIAGYIANRFGPLDRCTLVGHSVPQVQQTVERLSSILGLTSLWDERLRGTDLGVLAGLTRAEAAEQWPEAAKRLELWRMGRLRVDQLKIPCAESTDEFKDRIEAVLNDWLDMLDVSLSIAVCTTSALIMLTNLVQLGDAFSFDLYEAHRFDIGSISTVDVLDAHPQMVTINQTGHLEPDASRYD